MQQALAIPLQSKPIVRFNSQILKSNQCLNILLGQKIDLKWNQQHASMDITPSTQAYFSYQHQQKQQYFVSVPLLHKNQCPLMQKALQPNHDSIVSPCVVVLIQHKHTKKILATQRHERMSFGNLWVLPGGHLQKGERIYDGGLRQCMEQVGLKPEAVIHQKDPRVMVWESVNVDQKNLRVKRVALVFFFRIECQQFEIIEQKAEVKRWQWRQFDDQGFPWGGGWAQGHLRYLQFVKTSQIS